jgi:uncharacterized membrane protein YgdD (TMEM256/DUF423 family)
MHNKPFFLTGCLLGAAAVALGAFGAHGLKNWVPAETLTTFQTGVQYQMYHTLALLLTAIVCEKFPNRMIRLAGRLFILGIILFSGSLYLLTFFKAVGWPGGEKWGIITPLGGISFIAGWLCFGLAFIRKKNSER